MRNHSGANHVQINVYETAMQVLIRFDRCSVTSVSPERAVESFPLIVFLATAASDQLNAIDDNLWTGVSNQKVKVVAGYYVIKYVKTETLFRFETQRRYDSRSRANFRRKLFRWQR